MACEVWLRRDYLLRHGHEPDEPPCGHDPELCPPAVLADTQKETP